MSDAWADFDAPVPEPKHARTQKRRVTAANPRSTNPSDPYVNLLLEGLDGFDVVDRTSSVFDHPERIRVQEVSYNVARDRYAGYGPRILRSGGLSMRIEYVQILPADIPSAVRERLHP